MPIILKALDLAPTTSCSNAWVITNSITHKCHVYLGIHLTTELRTPLGIIPNPEVDYHKELKHIEKKNYNDRLTMNALLVLGN